MSLSSLRWWIVFEMSWLKLLDFLFVSYSNAYHLPHLNISVSWKWEQKNEDDISGEMKRCVEDWESVQWAIAPIFFRKWKWYQEKDWVGYLARIALQLFNQSTIHQLNCGQRILTLWVDFPESERESGKVIISTVDCHQCSRRAPPLTKYWSAAPHISRFFGWSSKKLKGYWEYL